MIILFLLCVPVRYQKGKGEGKEISFYKACKLLNQRFAEFITALISLYRLKIFTQSFYEALSLFAIKDIKKKPTPPKPQTEKAF